MRKNKTGSLHYGWVVLAIGTFAIFSALGLARFGYTMVFPAMQSGLGMDNGQAGLLATVSLAGYLAASIVGGPLAVRYGVRSVASAGLFLVGIGMVFTGLAHRLFPVAVWSGVTGIGSGAVNIAIMGLWPAWFSRKKRGTASGIAVAGSSIGLIFTGLAVPRVLNAFGETGWNVSWLIFGVITLVVAAGSYLILRNNPAEMGLKPIGEEMNQPPAPPGSPVLQWKSVYLSAPVWFLGLVYIAFGFSYIIYMTFFVKYLITDGGYSQMAAGRLFTLMGWVSLLCGLAWGAVSDSIGRKKTLTMIYLVHALSFGLFALGDAPYYFLFSAILFGLSAWSIPAVMAAACGDLLGPEMAPAALGFITLFFGIGQAVGPVTAGIIADMAGSFPPVFLLASGVALSGALGSALLLRKTYHTESPDSSEID